MVLKAEREVLLVGLFPALSLGGSVQQLSFAKRTENAESQREARAKLGVVVFVLIWFCSN
jgi:hypothetical protein